MNMVNSKVFNSDCVYLVWLRVEQVCVLRQRRSKGMMRRLQLLRLLLLGQEERKVHHPQEVECRRIPERDATRLQQLSTLQAKMTQQRALQNIRSEWENRSSQLPDLGASCWMLLSYHSVEGRRCYQQQVPRLGSSPVAQLVLGCD